MAMLPPGSGALTVATIPNPGAGNEIIFTAPARTRLRIIGLSFLYSTLAAGGNRNVTLEWNIGAALVGFAGNITAHVPGTNIAYSCNTGHGFNTAVLNGSQIIGLPTNLLLRAGMTLETFTLNLNAADTFTVITITYEEHMEL